MTKNGYWIWQVIGALLVIGLLAGGAYAAFQFGYANGVADSPAVATVLSEGLKNGEKLPDMYGYGLSRSYALFPRWGHPMGFFPFGGLLGFLLFIFLFTGLLRMIFWPRWAHHPHWYRHHPTWGYPPPWSNDRETPGSGAQEKPE